MGHSVRFDMAKRARPLRRLWRALRHTYGAPVAHVRNNSNSKQDRQFIVIVFPTFSHSTPLHCAMPPWETLFSFLPPPPLPVCVGARGWGDGECWVMQFRPQSGIGTWLP